MTSSADIQFCVHVARVLQAFKQPCRPDVLAYVDSNPQGEEPDKIAWHYLRGHVSSALSTRLQCDPVQSVALISAILKNLTPDASSAFRQLFNRLFDDSHLLALCAHAKNNQDVLYALATFYADIADWTTMNDDIAQAIEVLTGKPFEIYWSKDDPVDAVKTAMFGETWAALYSDKNMTIVEIMQAVFIDRPPIIGQASTLAPVSVGLLPNFEV